MAAQKAFIPLEIPSRSEGFLPCPNPLNIAKTMDISVCECPIMLAASIVFLP